MTVDVNSHGGERGWLLRPDERRHAHRTGRECGEQCASVPQPPLGANDLCRPVRKAGGFESARALVSLIQHAARRGRLCSGTVAVPGNRVEHE